MSTTSLPLFGFLLIIPLYIVRLCWCNFHVRLIQFGALYDVSYSSAVRSWTVGKLKFDLHWPRRESPYWAVVSLDELQYTSPSCRLSLQRGEAKLWFFPVFFRFTAGPWVHVALHDFTVHVNTSRAGPWWVDNIRRSLISAAVNGETIRLAHSDTKVYLNRVASNPANGDQGEEKKDLLAHTEDAVDAVDEGPRDEVRDDLRVRSTISQWHIFSPWNRRMYTFGSLEAELRRSWTEDRGSFVMIAKECRWTKVPALVQDKGYRKASAWWQILHGIYSLPLNIYEIYQSPMSTVDIHSARTDITFGDFRMRDAELFHEAALKLQLEYTKMEVKKPGFLGSIAWDAFVYAVLTVFEDKGSECSSS